MPQSDHRAFSGSDLCRMEAWEVVTLLKKGDVSPAEVLEASLSRIEDVDGTVNAFPTVCAERARRFSKNLNSQAQDHPGWLAGLPIGIKDLMPVAGVRTTYGTKGLADLVPDESTPLVIRLEQRGGVIVGKTNTPEFGAGGNTFNDVFGPTFNPWDTHLNAGGSSGGAAVSLATGQVWLSHGSDHGGSLRTPAAYNGIVGLRPSPGRIPGKGDASYLIEGVEGPMARSVRDCALFLDTMAGLEPGSPISYPADRIPYQQAVERADGRIRIGFAPDLNGFAPVEADMAGYLANAMARLERNGAEVIEVAPELPNLDRTYRVLRGIMWSILARQMPTEVTRHFKQTLRENTEFGQTLTIDDISDANLSRSAIYQSVLGIFEHQDVLACPVVGNMPRPQSEEWVANVAEVPLSGYMDWLKFAFLATVTGLPAITVPVGLSDNGLPIGLQLIGPPRGEARLLAAARAVEIAHGGPLAPIDPRIMSET